MPLWLKKRDKRRQHCNWTMTITILALVITRHFFTICAVGVSHLSVLVKQLLTNAV